MQIGVSGQSISSHLRLIYSTSGPEELSDKTANMKNHLATASLGLLPYREAWDIQIRVREDVAEGRRPDMLLLVEHPHVYTLGRRGQEDDILIDADALESLGIKVHHTDRGGEVTYHGPGQLVGYPILNLRRWGGGPLKYVRALERVLIEALAEFGVQRGERGASDRSLGRGPQDRGHWREGQPPCYDAWVRAERVSRPFVFRSHRPVRNAGQPRHVAEPGAWSSGYGQRCNSGPGEEICSGLRTSNGAIRF